jgi:hypothetical protein
MGKVSIEFTKNEAEAMANIIHVATKSAGIEGNVTRNGLYILDKINKAFESKPEEKKEVKEIPNAEIVKP